MKTEHKPELSRYWILNSWNKLHGPAYNLKIYKVIPPEYRDKVYEMLDCDDFYEHLNFLVHDFNFTHKGCWQVNWNGRSGGYIVLSRATTNATVEAEEVPANVLKAFEQLALDLIETTIQLATDYHVVDETYTVERERKVLIEN